MFGKIKKNKVWSRPIPTPRGLLGVFGRGIRRGVRANIVRDESTTLFDLSNKKYFCGASLTHFILADRTSSQSGRGTFRNHNKEGFTVVEMIVGAFIFSLVLVASVGAVLSIVSANIQAQTAKNVISNFSFSMESMVRNIRTGSDYEAVGCNITWGSGWPSNPNCINWFGWLGVSNLKFKNSSGVDSGYRVSDNKIQQKIGNDYVDITDPAVVIDSLRFWVAGRGNDNQQPSVLLVLTAHTTIRGKTTNFKIQTLAVQRKIDEVERP